MTSDDFAALDWQGRQLVCGDCTHGQLRQNGNCELAKACALDRYGVRIDRFFSWNPALAKQYLSHPYFEVRAIVARHVEVFYLPRLAEDADPVVRQSAAQRLPQRHLLLMRQDPDREVRIRVAARLDIGQLDSMMQDMDYYVRTIVARRIGQGALALMRRDPDRGVRVEVARRIDPALLAGLALDPELTVRVIVAQRLPPGQLGLLRSDPCWQVRYAVAQRIAPSELGLLLADTESVVRDEAWARRQAARSCLMEATLGSMA